MIRQSRCSGKIETVKGISSQVGTRKRNRLRRHIGRGSDTKPGRRTAREIRRSRRPVRCRTIHGKTGGKGHHNIRFRDIRHRGLRAYRTAGRRRGRQAIQSQPHLLQSRRFSRSRKEERKNQNTKK